MPTEITTRAKTTRKKTVRKGTGTAKRATSKKGDTKPMEQATKRKDFGALAEGMRITTNAIISSTGVAYDGTVTHADEFIILVRRDDGKKSKWTGDVFSITPKCLGRGAWWHLAGPMKCVKCGEVSTDVSHTAVGAVCEKCLKTMPVCEVCGGVHERTRATGWEKMMERVKIGKSEAALFSVPIGGKVLKICDKCLKDYAKCPTCGEVHKRKDLKEWYGRLTCKTCLKGRVVKCSECGADVDRKAAFRLKDGRPLCRSCSEGKRLAIPALRSKKSIVRKMEVEVVKPPKNNKNRMVGNTNQREN